MATDFPLTRTTRPLPAPERARVLESPGFGRHFTDHMATATWTDGHGWHGHRVGPLEPFSLHPSAAVLHYAQEIFEGLKAYRHADGSVWLFRPEANARRFARSARRLALPELPEEDFLAGVEALVRADEPWVPVPRSEESLYVRPFMFASEAFLGVRPAAEVVFSVIAGPAGPYFANGLAGVTLWVSSTYSRAAKGGTGAAKCGGNYASGLAAQLEAREHGCDQVLYLDSAGGGFLEESGTMNLCLVTADGHLVTPPLGTILEGVTRDTILALAPECGLVPQERPVTIDELRAGAADGTVTEVFAAGTAAVVTPIVGFKGDGYAFTVGDGEPGKHTAALRSRVLDIQFGRAKDTHGWLHRVL
ncbi:MULTISPECIES: branched-chain amino acid aminotransferase [Streptomyces]|uniref:branched-chain-amino-acid transaminase n=2 Tax=Streptomyces albus TaxID=1888 RepID=A0A8H1QIV5_9ACTN|nr:MULTISPECIES: branched-chain amino acid aminotransferase [Streptomyces]TGG74690.1 branched-chain amino acid aminotransferase [Streptomyces albus]UVN58362.1 branched-chain amino acid aminotransferase [Streptomyces albus]GHJ20969.1 branched-chain-amino-acid aminotransferase [Streptomyces albus]